MLSKSKPVARYIDLAPDIESFEHAVLSGLQRPQKTVSAKFFYDDVGSRLFEDICEQPEYYPTRTELGILKDNAARIAHCIGANAQLFEFGAGALEKVRIVLDALDNPAGFTAIDISGDHLREAADSLAGEYPHVPVTAICADYTQSLHLPEDASNPLGGKPHPVGFFPGSTIGNFAPEDAENFLATIRPLFEPDGLLIIGVDLRKESATLNAAYNDAAGITARFNLNLLTRINSELDGNFDLSTFAHKAFFNENKSRIEMHLESLKDQSVNVADLEIAFKKGETIHTEISCKYSIEDFQALAKKAGWAPVDVLTDARNLFSVHILKPEAG